MKHKHNIRKDHYFILVAVPEKNRCIYHLTFNFIFIDSDFNLYYLHNTVLHQKFHYLVYTPTNNDLLCGKIRFQKNGKVT